MPHPTAFAHEALFYSGTDDLVARLAPFLRDGVNAGEPSLVVLPADKIVRLREALGCETDGVTFADMDEVGRNPGRIIPAWREFVDAHASSGRKLRGIGEPINPDRHGAELAECHRHEALLNLEFADDPPLWLLCPYDVDALDADVVATAQRTHPLLRHDEVTTSAHYLPVDAAEPFAELLSASPDIAVVFSFSTGALHDVRAFVEKTARALGLGDRQVDDLVLAVNEMATNSVRHGGGDGRVGVWIDEGWLVCEVADAGVISEPLLGRRVPSVEGESGRGHWMANQLCDLVQVHSSRSSQTAVRLFMRLAS